MASDIATSIPANGFKFDNCLRNSYFSSKGLSVPKTKKTGTTIVGIVFKDGVILGADTRATVGPLIAEKNCNKIHYLAKNLYACGAGTAADTEQVSKMVSSQLELHRLSTDRVVPVVVAERLFIQHLFRYQGHIGAAMIIGGVDFTGPHLYEISPWGCSSKLPFVTMGSGSLAAMSVLEKGFKLDMNLEEGKALVRDAICAGIFNDLGSGSNVDLCIITAEGAKHLRPYDIANKKGERQEKYSYKPGTTKVLSTEVIPLDVVETIVRADEDMDTA